MKTVISQLKVLGMDKVEMGEMKIEMIKRNTEILGLVLKMIVKRVIQSKLEITPQQLSQVKVEELKEKTSSNNCWST